MITPTYGVHSRKGCLCRVDPLGVFPHKGIPHEPALERRDADTALEHQQLDRLNSASTRFSKHSSL